MSSNYRTATVAVAEDYRSAFFGKGADRRLFFIVLKEPEAVYGNYGRVKDRIELDFIVTSFDENDLVNFYFHFYKDLYRNASAFAKRKYQNFKCGVVIKTSGLDLKVGVATKLDRPLKRLHTLF